MTQPAAALLICRPVDATKLHRLAPHIPVPDPHEGSTIGECEDCRAGIYIGPVQATLVAEHSNARRVVLLCILCGIKAMREAGVDPSSARPLTNKTVPARFADGTIGDLP